LVFIPGFHAVRETLLKGQSKIHEVWVAEDKKGARIKEIIRLAQERGVPVHFKRHDDLDHRLPDLSHQGLVALTERFTYGDLNHIIDRCFQGSGHGLIIAADHITDEGNLGALIRTAAFFGVHGLILPRDRSAKVSERVLKRSSGGHAHLPIAQVVNLARSLDLLAKKGFWIIGAAGESPESIHRIHWDKDLVVVLGSEHKGLGHSVRKHCDQLVSIPGSGKVDSLNVSVAGGIILSEIRRQRGADRKDVEKEAS
jgi:23S rRNA (guanosine2251-2'-O)-methyltransferase